MCSDQNRTQKTIQKNDTSDRVAENNISLLLLLIGIAIMVVGSTYPIVFTDANGEADHGIAMCLFWAMSAGIVRGVGFVPNNKVFRWLFSGWACLLGLALTIILRFQ